MSDNLDGVLTCIMELLEILGVEQLNLLSSAYELKIDESWHLAINGKDFSIEVNPVGSMPVVIQPYNFAIWYNGWFAGMFDHVNGGWFAAGSGANEETFRKAVSQRIEAENGQNQC